jgi:hypothetical protein
MSVVTQLYFQIVEENNYMFRPFSGWAIIRLRLEYREKLILQRGHQEWGNEISSYNVWGVLRRIFIHLISTSIESHNGDDATKDSIKMWILEHHLLLDRSPFVDTYLCHKTV